MSQYFLYPRTTLVQILLYLLYTHILGQRAKRTILAIADLAKNNKKAALLVFLIFTVVGFQMEAVADPARS